MNTETKKFLTKTQRHKDMKPLGDYGKWFAELKQRLLQSQIQAAVKVNAELLRMYWDLGRDIVSWQMDSQWGASFFETLSKDLKREFPDMQGLSPRNLRYMQDFYVFYAQDKEILHQAGAKLDSEIFSIPWRHQVELNMKAEP